MYNTKIITLQSKKLNILGMVRPLKRVQAKSFDLKKNIHYNSIRIF